jgi:SAM-dependent methyltransferase
MTSKKQLLELYDDGDLYDLENSRQEDIDFWKSVVEPPKVSSFLELCCGTGRIGAELLPFLHTYHGVDLSNSFLETFRRKNPESLADFELFQGDMKNISTGRSYDVVAIPFNSLSHLYTFEDISETLQNVKRHMNQNARFVFDIHNPSLELLLRDPIQEFIAKEFVDPKSKKKIIVYESNRYDRSTQINHISWRYVNQDGSELKRLELPMRVFFPSEMDNCLLYQGFKIEAKYGTFDKKKFDSKSPKQIYVCQNGG